MTSPIIDTFVLLEQPGLKFANLAPQFWDLETQISIAFRYRVMQGFLQGLSLRHRRSWLRSWLDHRLPLGPQATHLTSLCLSFHSVTLGLTAHSFLNPLLFFPKETGHVPPCYVRTLYLAQ